MRRGIGVLVVVSTLALATGNAYAGLIWLDLTLAHVYDPSGHITVLAPSSVTFQSVDGRGDWTGLWWENVSVPDGSEGALMFDIDTVLAAGSNPTLGNVNVGVGFGPGDAYYLSVQGTFSGTLGIDLRGYSVLPFISIGFPGAVYEAGEFTATVSNLRVPDPGSTLLLLGIGLVALLVGLRAWRNRRQ